MENETTEEKKSKSFSENSDLEKFKKELDNDVKLNLANIREKSLTVAAIRAKWLGYYMNEKNNSKRIAEYKAKILAAKAKNVSNSILKAKTEALIASEDEKIIKLNKLAEYSKENLEFLQNAMIILADFGFTIKNTIEILKLEKT